MWYNVCSHDKPNSNPNQVAYLGLASRWRGKVGDGGPAAGVTSVAHKCDDKKKGFAPPPPPYMYASIQTQCGGSI